MWGLKHEYEIYRVWALAEIAQDNEKFKSANVFVKRITEATVGRLTSAPLPPLSLGNRSGPTCSVLLPSRHHKPAALLLRTLPHRALKLSSSLAFLRGPVS